VSPPGPTRLKFASQGRPTRASQGLTANKPAATRRDYRLVGLESRRKKGRRPVRACGASRCRQASNSWSAAPLSAIAILSAFPYRTCPDDHAHPQPSGRDADQRRARPAKNRMTRSETAMDREITQFGSTLNERPASAHKGSRLRTTPDRGVVSRVSGESPFCPPPCLVNDPQTKRLGGHATELIHLKPGHISKLKECHQ
jgi:hypothetical protein